jgi:hypothetical protein
MAGRIIPVFLLIGALTGSPALAGDKHDDQRPSSEPWSKEKGNREKGRESSKWDSILPKQFREKLEKMSPSERGRFVENWQKWQQMEDKERQEIRSRAMIERENIEIAINDAITELGLKLEGEQWEAFAQRYRQERRKIEHTLCKEMKAKREVMVTDAMARLKDEFSGETTVIVEKTEPVEVGTKPPPVAGSSGQ